MNTETLHDIYTSLSKQEKRIIKLENELVKLKSDFEKYQARSEKEEQ